jgi:hypothetical protein
MDIWTKTIDSIDICDIDEATNECLRENGVEESDIINVQLKFGTREEIWRKGDSSPSQYDKICGCPTKLINTCTIYIFERTNK